MKGLVVAVVAALTPLATALLIIFTDGVPIEETEGSNYAGLIAMAYIVGGVVGPTAAWLWNRVRKVRRWSTVMFIAPSLMLLLLVTLVVISGDCLNETSPC